MKSFVLLGCPFPGSLARGSRLLFGLFFLLSLPSFLSRLPIFSTLSLEYVKQKRKPKELTRHCAICWVPKFLVSALVSPPFRSVLFVTRRFLPVLSRRNRKKYFYCIIPRSGSLTTKFQETTTCKVLVYY